MDNEALIIEVSARITILNGQATTTQTYLLERVREEDWSSVMVAASHLSSISQELESLSVVRDTLQESYYE